MRWGDIKIVFYNVNKNNDIDPLLLDIVHERQIELLVLAEYNNCIDELCNKVNQISSKSYHVIQNFGGCTKISGLIWSNYKQEIILEDSRYIILHLSNVFFSAILGMIHVESKLNSDDTDRQATYQRFVNDISDAETLFDTKNTMLLGDFNANPFELNMINANVLHAIPYKEEVSRKTRVISGISYEKFYNPMWKLIGSTKPPYGTYHYNTSKAINFFWNIFDQVIFRPSILEGFEEDSLEIICKTQHRNLLKNGYKPDDTFSDHLPIYFEIREEKLK